MLTHFKLWFKIVRHDFKFVKRKFINLAVSELIVSMAAFEGETYFQKNKK